ncbi:CD276 antigen isoform X1 [Gymnodraco acuticeps]|uniref:CD276 antigen isoform X1 n=1 Tax=Gymnodraco acuticeps TaxID=8218 RepID=A0A6P8T718_GYMAC|nr:CD276 antigen isoform X1 [Gymnodraco acuticeps]XP_034059421.1 CD276 antigen isoform X1 [Gymnodraco acuticeps]
MASNGVLLLFTFIHLSIGHTAFVDLEVRAENVGKYGQQSLLECVYIHSPEAEGGKLVWVEWKKEGVEEALLSFHKGSTTAESGYSFAEPSWNTTNRNVSLLITSTSVKDQGEYTCNVMTESGDGFKNTRLRVTAKYNKPAIKLDPQTSTLMCDSDSGYPEGQLCWFDEFGTEWTKSSQMEAKKTESGLFNLSSKLTLMDGSTFSSYTCKVFNVSGGNEEEATYTVQEPEKTGRAQGNKMDGTTKVVAPLVVIGSLIVGLLLLMLLLYKRRSQLVRRFSTRPLIMGDHQPVDTCDSPVEQGEDQSCPDSPA